MLLVATHSFNLGPSKTVATIGGNATGLLILSILSVLGLSALVAYSATIFLLVKAVGAAYLVYLGVKLWLKGVSGLTVTESPDELDSAFVMYRQGLLVAISNPKAIIFTMALFPQFLDTSSPLLEQFSILVTTLIALSVVCLYGCALLVGKAKAKVVSRVNYGLFGKFAGATFIGLGLSLLAATSKA